jgi:hypothetical protein
MEFRSVRTGGQIDLNRGRHAFRGYVELGQALANLAGAHPHDGVLTQFRLGLPAEDVDGQGSLFQRSGFTGQPFLANVIEKLLAPLAAVKSWTRQNGAQLALYLFRLW